MPQGSTAAARAAETAAAALDVLRKSISVDVHTHGGKTGVTSEAPPNDRLIRRYGEAQGLRLAPRWKLGTAAESEHPQAGGPHLITLVHGFWPVTAAALATTC